MRSDYTTRGTIRFHDQRGTKRIAKNNFGAMDNRLTSSCLDQSVMQRTGCWSHRGSVLNEKKKNDHNIIWILRMISLSAIVRENALNYYQHKSLLLVLFLSMSLLHSEFW